MKEITVLSGKGGTGKTSISTALASVASGTIFCDNDVDAANLHLILHPENIETNPFLSGWNVTIDKEKCTGCMECARYCRFDAIHINIKNNLYINSYQCEGCRVCERICPAEAIKSEKKNNNRWYVSDTRFGTLVHASMEPGEENSGKLVTQVRKRAREIAAETGSAYILNDGPPGIGCAAIASISGTDIVLIIIEPTKSGLHDAQRLIKLIRSFHVKTYAVINKHNLNPEMTTEIKKYLKKMNIPVLARIPFDKEMVEAVSEGKAISEYNPDSEITGKIKYIWKMLKEKAYREVT